MNGQGQNIAQGSPLVKGSYQVRKTAMDLNNFYIGWFVESRYTLLVNGSQK